MHVLNTLLRGVGESTRAEIAELRALVEDLQADVRDEMSEIQERLEEVLHSMLCPDAGCPRGGSSTDPSHREPT